MLLLSLPSATHSLIPRRTRTSFTTDTVLTTTMATAVATAAAVVMAATATKSTPAKTILTLAVTHWLVAAAISSTLAMTAMAAAATAMEVTTVAAAAATEVTTMEGTTEAAVAATEATTAEAAVMATMADGMNPWPKNKRNLMPRTRTPVKRSAATAKRRLAAGAAAGRAGDPDLPMGGLLEVATGATTAAGAAEVVGAAMVVGMVIPNSDQHDRGGIVLTIYIGDRNGYGRRIRALLTPPTFTIISYQFLNN
ncbi:hypothetical protein GGS24DRAFT_394643 [Hypoxylon argillaceum]|nr:hypothetical protein GGS24DRAFT_394643 [Hypoxylon argillaceum]